jgi:POT family proton-dependent oligopeptide transporter
MTTADTRTILGHPPGLFVLFFSELWERFCFYGMRNILTLYLTTVMLWDQSSASNLYGWYTMLVYVTSILGGYMADRVLGMRKAIIAGGFMMMLGEFALVMEGVVPFYTGLALLIVGTGFFKPNVSSIVGGLYAPGDVRRDSAFHAAQMHRGSAPRFMAQPPLHPSEPFRLERADGDYSPVERSIRQALQARG